MAAVEPPKTTSSPDSYIGSLISLTSKSEIRYEGLLYDINTHESSIALRNVRSFGTEGRKKDGPQVAPSDKVYEYILFRGSDIKDLQVKSSPPVQSAAAASSSVDNDPAIIQSHYPHHASTSTNMPPAVGTSTSDSNSHGPQLGHPGSDFQGALPLYQPGGNLGSWGPSPPTGANGGLAMPMYWPGFYGPPSGLPQSPQHNLFRPPPGLSMPPSLQQPMQYSRFNPAMSAGATNLLGSKLPEIPPSLISSSSSSSTVPSTSLPALMPLVPSTSLASETISSSGPSKAGLLSTPMFPSISSFGISASDSSTIVSAVSNSVSAMSSSNLPGLSLTQPTPSITSSAAPIQIEEPTPSLVTPDQLLKTVKLPISSAPPPQVAHKDVEVVQVSSSVSSTPKVEVAKEAQPPILPLPPAARAFHKHNVASYQPRHNYNYRGRDRGRGRGNSRGVTRFTEDFDFMAMNEKFKKDEVWGHLGKSDKSRGGEEEGLNGGDSSEEETEEEMPKIEVKPLYNKDDFFDTLSSNALDRESQNGRTRFSEQLKIDAETFGDFARYRGGHGGRGPGHGWRGRGGYYGRGYGYAGQGWGRGMPGHSS